MQKGGLRIYLEPPFLSTTDIAGNVVKNLSTGEIYCYNAYDEVVSYTDAEGNVTKVVYDAQGNVASTTDALDNSTSYTYRKDGLLTEIKDASGAVTLYEYNNKGLVSKETDALGTVTTYEYDNENRPVKVVTPDGTVTEYSYNTDGSVTRVTATKANGESETLNYLYALDGSLTASISNSDILEYTYNNRGSVASVTKNNNHQVKLTYDGNGNMTRLEELTKGVTESVTNYAYDNRGYLTKVSSEEGTLVTYISRADGLLEQVTDGVGNVTKYQYDQKKQVTGLTITAEDGSVLYSEKNTYDKNGSLLTQSISGTGYDAESLAYTYDALDRLLSETNKGVTTTYTYDSMGNRLTKISGDVTTAYTYDLCNKLLSETTGEEETTYSYDALGNLTEKVSSAGATTYAYDALNQLIKVTNPDGTWQSNTYDASGIRFMITENGITTEFINFNGLVLSGYDKTGEQTEHYYYGNSLIAAEDAQNAETALYYYLTNSHGDVIGLTDTYGTLTETYRYDAFGTLTSIQSLNENGELTEAEKVLSRFLYAGEQLDNTTGLYYLRARQYDTVLGRFTQEDTYLGDGRNLYVYVRNNPLKYVDPSGHCGKGLGYDIDERINQYYINGSLSAEENRDEYFRAKEAWDNSYYGRLQNSLENDLAGSIRDYAKGFSARASELFFFDLLYEPSAVQHEEAFQEGQQFCESLYICLALQSMGIGPTGSSCGSNSIPGGTSGSTQVIIPQGGNSSVLVIIPNTYPVTAQGDTILAPVPLNGDLRSLLNQKQDKVISAEELPDAASAVKLAGSDIRHLNGSIAELQGYYIATQNGEVGIQAPGVVTASGPDYITYDPESQTINVWDAKYSSSGKWPNSVQGFKSEKWLDEVEEAINNLDDLDLKNEILDAFKNNRIDWQIFKWPQ